MAATSKIEELEPPEEKIWFDQLYAGAEFYDDASGVLLNKEEAIKARMTEIDFFKQLGVYSKIRREAWMKIISTEWLDINKQHSGDWPNITAKGATPEDAEEWKDKPGKKAELSSNPGTGS